MWKLEDMRNKTTWHCTICLFFTAKQSSQSGDIGSRFDLSIVVNPNQIQTKKQQRMTEYCGCRWICLWCYPTLSALRDRSETVLLPETATAKPTRIRSCNLRRSGGMVVACCMLRYQILQNQRENACADLVVKDAHSCLGKELDVIRIHLFSASALNLCTIMTDCWFLE